MGTKKRVTGYGLRDKGCVLRVLRCELRLKGCGTIAHRGQKQMTIGCELPVTGCEL